MNTIHATRVPVLPTNSDGLLIPRLIPVAALLCCEGYADAARSRILERLADGVSPRDCARDGLLEWADLAEVERLTAPRPAARPAVVDEDVFVASIDAGLAAHTHFDADLDAAEPFDLDVPRAMTPSEYRDALRELVAEFTDA